MIWNYLIHLAIWTHFAVSHATGMHFDLFAAKSAAAPVAEKVVLRETTLSEELDLDIDLIARPDKEIAAVQEEARRLMSSIDIATKARGLSWETPDFRRILSRPDWSKTFALDWDDEWGFTLGGTHHPVSKCNDNQVFSFITSFPR